MYCKQVVLHDLLKAIGGNNSCTIMINSVSALIEIDFLNIYTISLWTTKLTTASHLKV